jgi:hypothetical protein
VNSASVPFYTQTKLLDLYAHSTEPSRDQDMLDFILALLDTRPELRTYFFQTKPSPAWATILWEHGFFEAPPAPDLDERGAGWPRWLSQEYLISVAGQVPDVVVRHVQTLEGPAVYKARALEALCRIPPGSAAQAIPHVLEWLADPQVAPVIASQAFDLIMRFAEGKDASSALDVFEAITAPVRMVASVGSEPVPAEASSRFDNLWNVEEAWELALDRLAALDASRLMLILENRLRETLRLEWEGRDGRTASDWWWYGAFDDRRVGRHDPYRVRLLRAIGRVLGDWARAAPQTAEPVLARYLSSELVGLRKLGLDLLRQNPDAFPALVTEVLSDLGNLHDIRIQREHLLLLERGFGLLPPPDQASLFAAICQGPTVERLNQFATWAEMESDSARPAYVERQRKQWVLDRLWMIRRHLHGADAETLNRLVSELGEPTHSVTDSWSTQAYWIQEVSPVAASGLSQMSVDELIGFLANWQPPSQRKPGPEEISYTGLARALASAVLANPEKYGSLVSQIALLRPEYAFAILDRVRDPGNGPSMPWEQVLNLCEDLLAEDFVRQSMERFPDASWVGVRQWIVTVLEVGLNNPDRLLPPELLPRVRKILLILLDDPDPDLEADRPSKGWFGHNDPATVAINHVRPMAMAALLDYVTRLATWSLTADLEETAREPGPQRWEPEVRQALTRKLDRTSDPSRAVHSVFGRYLPRLYWLDVQWVESHIGDILPQTEAEDARWIFASAWDSFVNFNRYYPPMLGLLGSHYVTAIDYLSQGYATGSDSKPGQGLAAHITWEYLQASYDLNSAVGQDSLIVRFCRSVVPSVRAEVPFVLWRILEVNPGERAQHWPRARTIWEWRAREAAQAGNSAEFGEEMHAFSRLLNVLPLAAESISTLRPLLEGLLPYITVPDFPNQAWESVQEFLASEVDRDPQGVIQFYRLMHAQRSSAVTYYPEEAFKIVRTCAASTDSRSDALSLIDSLGRLGDHRFRDIYDKYSR